MIPLSALDGDNISRNSEKTPWYKGPSLLDLMDGLDAQLEETGDFCLNVQCILRNSSGRRWAAGTIAHGQIQVDEPIKILASGQTSRVREILLAGLPAQKAKAGDAVALALYDERDLDRGSLLHKPDRKLSASQAWQAQIVWFDDEAWHPEERYILRLGTQTTRVQISSILHRFNLETLKPEAASDLHLNDIALVQLESTQALYALPYHESRIFGAFILIDPRTYRTVAAGMIAQLGAQQGLRSNRLHDTKRGSPEWEDAAQDPRHLRLPLSFLQDNSVGTQMRAIEDLLEQGWRICLEASDEAMHIKTRLATKGLGTFKDGLGI
ncbi:MAG: hypothetical protein NTX25_14665 [Proteobacteria bacterium]|nr:hypothetical protein [Pseudomonadota bacterium]